MTGDWPPFVAFAIFCKMSGLGLPCPIQVELFQFLAVFLFHMLQVRDHSRSGGIRRTAQTISTPSKAKLTKPETGHQLSSAFGKTSFPCRIRFRQKAGEFLRCLRDLL